MQKIRARYAINLSTVVQSPARKVLHVPKSGMSVFKALDLDVVICAKNRAEVLERVLQQIIREVPFRELIVIYASSKDGTKEIAEKYAKKVFWDGDKGLGAARNLGMRKASSELVAMIDTDVSCCACEESDWKQEW